MSNSKLVDYVRISPNSTNPRNHKIDTITIHHLAGVGSVETIGNIFADPSREASCNYGIGSDGRIALIVDEANRSWCSSSRENDHRAITIEVSNSERDGVWPVSDHVLARLIDLCVDICQRNDIEKLNFTGDKSGNLTMHKWFAATGCPGEYLGSKFPYIAEEVNKRLGVSEEPEHWYRVRKSWEDAASQIGAYKDLEYAKAGCPEGYSVFDWNGNCIYYNGGGEFVTDAYPQEEFVRDIQKACGAAVDGIAGPETLSKTVTLSQYINTTHAAVKPVQERLFVLGYQEVGEADGITGPKFDMAVKAFQKDNDCYVDGEITAQNKTWRKLLGMG